MHACVVSVYQALKEKRAWVRGYGVIGNFSPPRKCPPREFSLVNTVPQALFSSEYCPPGALFT